MAAWVPPDKYEGVFVPPATTAQNAAPPRAVNPDSVFDGIAAAIEELYAREPKLMRNLLQQLRAASTEDLERLFDDALVQWR